MKLMSTEQANKIKDWRLLGANWRVLAENACIQWGIDSPKTQHFPKVIKKSFGNQLYGRDLQNLAETILNEQFDV